MIKKLWKNSLFLCLAILIAYISAKIFYFGGEFVFLAMIFITLTSLLLHVKKLKTEHKK